VAAPIYALTEPVFQPSNDRRNPDTGFNPKLQRPSVVCADELTEMSPQRCQRESILPLAGRICGVPATTLEIVKRVKIRRKR
jgi:hypothetical protein